jgi:protein-disulfide isomerase
MVSRLVATSLLCVLSLSAQDGITRAQADAILNELRQIRVLLEKQNAPRPPEPPPKPTNISVNLQGREFLGSKDAPLTMVQFTDYQCPFCQRFHTMTFPEIKTNYIDTGKLKFYSLDMPLDFHPNAAKAAQAARCAGEQKKFWPMHEILGANAAKLDMESLTGFAKQLNLDTGEFRKCVESGKYTAAVQKDMAEAARVGANGTPTFLVGRTTPEGVTGELVEGALPYGMFDQKLKSLEAAAAAAR